MVEPVMKPASSEAKNRRTARATSSVLAEASHQDQRQDLLFDHLDGHRADHAGGDITRADSVNRYDGNSRIALESLRNLVIAMIDGDDFVAGHP